MTRSPKQPRIGVVTQARTTSTRLPRKVLINIGGRTVLAHHLQRLEASELPVFVATTANRDDDAIAEIAAASGSSVFRGSEHDVLSRYHGCAVEYDLDIVVRVTSDCPLIDGTLVRDAVSQYVDANEDRLYLSNTLDRTYPRGFDIEVFDIQLLTEAQEEATAAGDREHVTPYIHRLSPDRVTVRQFRRVPDRSWYRVTLDTDLDLTLIRALIERFGAAEMNSEQIIALLDEHTELVALNASVQQKSVIAEHGGPHDETQ